MKLEFGYDSAAQDGYDDPYIVYTEVYLTLGRPLEYVEELEDTYYTASRIQLLYSKKKTYEANYHLPVIRRDLIDRLAAVLEECPSGTRGGGPEGVLGCFGYDVDSGKFMSML
jgi:hypothetical protein